MFVFISHFIQRKQFEVCFQEKLINFIGETYGFNYKKFVFRTGFQAPAKISTSIRNAWRMHCYNQLFQVAKNENIRLWTAIDFIQQKLMFFMLFLCGCRLCGLYCYESSIQFSGQKLNLLFLLFRTKFLTSKPKLIDIQYLRRCSFISKINVLMISV